jgi:hypothetical protein
MDSVCSLIGLSVIGWILFSDCGGYLYLEEDSVTEAFITSPNYPDQTGQGKICRWVVKVK